MCLSIDNEITAQVKDRAQTHPTETITVWKIICRSVHDENHVPPKKEFVGWDFEHPENQWIYREVSPGYTVPAVKQLRSIAYEGHEWKPGENVSTRARTELDKFESTRHQVDLGFHVYRTFPSYGSGYRAIQLTAQLKDFVAANLTEMVFAKVTLSQEEYNRVINDQPIPQTP